MSEPGALRFLATVKRQLGADDARLEFGGSPPATRREVWAELSEHWRIVVRFSEPPTDGAARRQKLMALCAAFPSVVDAVVSGLPVDPSEPSPAQQALEELLATVAAVVGAHWVGVLVAGTEAVVGASSGAANTLVGRAIAQVAKMPTRETATVDDSEPGSDARWLVRTVAGVYHLVTVMDGPFSELAVEGQIIRAAPLVAARIAALDTVDDRGPDGSGGARQKVVPIRS